MTTAREITLETIENLERLEKEARVDAKWFNFDATEEERDKYRKAGSALADALMGAAPDLLAAAKSWMGLLATTKDVQALCECPSISAGKIVFDLQERIAALEADNARLCRENNNAVSVLNESAAKRERLEALVREAAHELVNCESPQMYPHETCGKCRECLWLEKVIKELSRAEAEIGGDQGESR